MCLGGFERIKEFPCGLVMQVSFFPYFVLLFKYSCFHFPPNNPPHPSHPHLPPLSYPFILEALSATQGSPRIAREPPEARKRQGTILSCRFQKEYGAEVMWTPANRDHVLWLQWTNSHGLQKSCGEKGMGWPLSEWERAKRAREPCPMSEQAFIAFLDTLHGGWSSFTMDRLAVGDYLLQITKERMLLITSKRRML